MIPKEITIETAKEISSFSYDEVIIVGANYETGIQHLTTYGTTDAAKSNAAMGGNAIKELLLKWPKDKCNDKPLKHIEDMKSEAIAFAKWMDNSNPDDIIGKEWEQLYTKFKTEQDG